MSWLRAGRSASTQRGSANEGWATNCSATQRLAGFQRALSRVVGRQGSRRAERLRESAPSVSSSPHRPPVKAAACARQGIADDREVRGVGVEQLVAEGAGVAGVRGQQCQQGTEAAIAPHRRFGRHLL